MRATGRASAPAAVAARGLVGGDGRVLVEDAGGPEVLCEDVAGVVAPGLAELAGGVVERDDELAGRDELDRRHVRLGLEGPGGVLEGAGMRRRASAGGRHLQGVRRCG